MGTPCEHDFFIIFISNYLQECSWVIYLKVTFFNFGNSYWGLWHVIFILQWIFILLILYCVQKNLNIKSIYYVDNYVRNSFFLLSNWIILSNLLSCSNILKIWCYVVKKNYNMRLIKINYLCFIIVSIFMKSSADIFKWL